MTEVSETLREEAQKKRSKENEGLLVYETQTALLWFQEKASKINYQKCK